MATRAPFFTKRSKPGYSWISSRVWTSSSFAATSSSGGSRIRDRKGVSASCNFLVCKQQFEAAIGPVCVCDYDAHVAPYWKRNLLLARGLQIFFKNIPYQMGCRHNQPPTQTLRDKFESLMKNRKERNTASGMAARILEEASDVDQLLDDLL